MQFLLTDVTSYSNSSNLMSCDQATSGSFAPYCISLWCVHSTINISTAMSGNDRDVLIHSMCTPCLACAHRDTDGRTVNRKIPADDITTGTLAARMCHTRMCRLIIYRMQDTRSYDHGAHTHVLLLDNTVVLNTGPESVATTPCSTGLLVLPSSTMAATRDCLMPKAAQCAIFA